MFENGVSYVNVEVEREKWKKEVVLFPIEVALSFLGNEK
jgi:hypothetical protein